jgi:hypothetical protein
MTTTTALPDFRRLRYFHGQMLGAHDFQREQDYFREKLKLRNRCLHGYGVVCGLHVEPVPPEHPCDPDPEQYREERQEKQAELEHKLAESEDKLGQVRGKRQQQRLEGEIERYRLQLAELSVSSPAPTPGPRVRITAGVALDCHGNELVVSHPCEADLWRLLSPEDRRKFNDGDSLYVSIEYCERPVEPTRGVFTNGCGNASDCEFGWRKDDFAVRVTLEEPATDECADTCCALCEDARLLLARIDGVERGQPVDGDSIHEDVRRRLSRYRFTTITGISWMHDGGYTPPEAREVLGTDDPNGGLVVRFSKVVRTSTLVDGIVDLQVVQGGRGRSAYSYFIPSEVVRPTGDYTDELRFRQTSDEGVELGDRVLITVRTAFVLDRCCRPVDGTHVGGRVPQLPGYQPRGQAPSGCAVPPDGIGPWTSGTGVGGDVFESWIYVREAST